MQLVTLEVGPIWRMQLLQTLLEERGVPSFLPDANLKTIDPAITGLLAFDARLEVPVARLEEARAVLREAAEELEELSQVPPAQGAPASAAEGAPEPADFGEARRLVPPAEAGREDLEALGRRLRWAVLLIVTQPFAVLYAWRYFRGLARGLPRPRGHRYNLAALVLMLAAWAIALSGYV